MQYLQEDLPFGVCDKTKVAGIMRYWHCSSSKETS